jgi:CHAT domain-containing protein/Tfp pilus assembly protein PilF
VKELERLAPEIVALSRAGKYDEGIARTQRAIVLVEKALGPDNPSVATFLTLEGTLYQAKGEYARAVPLHLRALAIQEKGLNAYHPDVATSLDKLAEAYEMLGDHARAEPLCVRSLAIKEKTLGRDDPGVALSLNNLAVVYDARAEYGRAEPLYLRALAIREKALGPDDLGVAESLNNLGTLYQAKGDIARAEPLHLRALAIKEKAQGPDHPNVAMSLANLAAVYAAKGEYARAEPLHLRALAIRENALGPLHPDVANSLNNLANLYEARGEYARAEPLLLRALAIREHAFGPENADVATSLTNLAKVHDRKGEYGQAEPLLQRSLAIIEKTLGPDHPNVAVAVNNLGELYWAKGEYTRAEPLFVRALAIFEKALGPSEPRVAITLHNLAALYQARGEYGRAETFYLRALVILESALGPNHPDVAQSLNNLALVYDARAEYGRAAPLFQRALAIDERALGPNHPAVALLLNNFAGLYQKTGEYDRAEPLQLRALAIQERALGPDHPQVAISLNNLAALYQRTTAYDKAEQLYLRALAIQEKAFGPGHPEVAGSLSNLAWLYSVKGEYARAEPFNQRALAIREKTLGPDHADVATSFNNLAEMYRQLGDPGRAEPLYQRALAIEEKALGPEHPAVANSLNNLALLHWATGRLPEAIQTFTRAENVAEKTLDRIVTDGSEAQKRAYLASLSGESGVVIALALEAHDPAAARLALTTLLRRKGRALDATAAGVSSLRARLGPVEQTMLDELAAARSQYITLVLRGPLATPQGAYRESLGKLDEQIREREIAIGTRSAVYRIERQQVTLAAVQSAMPEDAALVEWVVYRPFNLKAHSEGDKWRPARYAACVLPRHDDPTWIDLGDAKSIDEDIQSFLGALRRPASTDVLSLAAFLEARIMTSVRAVLGTTRRVLLSPDGALNLIPFATLVGDDNRPLIERYSFTYLTSGRDLLRLALPTPKRDDALILANPDFDAASARPGARHFLPLLHAEEEAATIARLFPDTTVLLRGDATKQSLRDAHGPRFLHIGTHGYFEPTACMTDPGRTTEAQTAALENPLLQSGIALAGANACAAGQSEGLLTAFEASSLDLHGTKLVTLSACQTGVGDATAGDGVYGLRRALVLAGAETQVMTLWPVDGEATADLMKAYYQALARGGRRSEAMRGVQLTMLHDRRWQHPYYWASFIVSGDDRRLDENIAPPDLRVHPGGACRCTLGSQPSHPAGAWFAGAAILALARRRALRYGSTRPGATSPRPSSTT